MYFVNEIQNDTLTPYSFDDKTTAFEKFFQIAAFIPKSILTIHTVTLQNETGENQFPPITKAIVD